LRDRVRHFQSELVEKTREATTVEDENKDQVRDQSHLAYTALCKVEAFLKVEDSGKRLSRQNPAIVTTLDEAAGHFCALSEISPENASQMGTYAAHFMALGDQAAAFVGDLQSYADTFSTDAPYIWGVINSYKSTLEDRQRRTEELENQLDSAEDSRGMSIQQLRSP
jgi:hypothetical protein